jgi:hypothetical protein
MAYETPEVVALVAEWRKGAAVEIINQTEPTAVYQRILDMSELPISLDAFVAACRQLGIVPALQADGSWGIRL